MTALEYGDELTAAAMVVVVAAMVVVVFTLARGVTNVADTRAVYCIPFSVL
jgi:hypothetical protein